MARFTCIAPALALASIGFVLGCTTAPQRTAELIGPPGKPSATCKVYTGSRLCREPYEVPQSLSCDAFDRSIAQGYANAPGAQSCYGPTQGVDASPDASIPGATRR